MGVDKDNLVSFFSKHSVDYRESGANVGRSNINVNCPFCATDDDYHLGISLEGKGWGCWRDDSHRGKSLPRLLLALTDCDYQEIADHFGFRKNSEVLFTNKMVGTGNLLIDMFVKDLDPFSKNYAIGYEQKLNHTELPKGCRNDWDSRMATMFKNYLVNRGFPKHKLLDIVKDFNLYYAVNGDQKNRIVFPITMDNKLVSWTGRSILKEDQLRYKSSRSDDSVVNIYDSLFNYDDLFSGGRALIVGEGPFDALKFDYFAKKYDCRATAIFTKTMSEDQIGFLDELYYLYDRVVLILDPEEIEDMLHLESKLSYMQNVSYHILEDAEDLGAMTGKQVMSLCKSL